MAAVAGGLKLMFRFFALVAFACIALPNSLHGNERDRFAEYDMEMFQRPKLPEPVRTRRFASGLTESWLKAIDRPDAELRRLVIDTLAIAYRRGVEGTRETEPRLLEVLDEPNLDLDVARAVANTLIVFDARDHDERLAQLVGTYGPPLGEIVEPALIAWESDALKPQWMARIDERSGSRKSIIRAMDGLAALGATDAADTLAKYVEDSSASFQVRVAAARSLGAIRASGNGSLVANLLNQTTTAVHVGPLLAIELLSRHDDPDSVTVLLDLAGHESTAIQSCRSRSQS